MNSLFNGNCIDVMNTKEFKDAVSGKQIVIVTDPPFNIGFHYRSYKDKMKQDAYYDLLESVFANYPFVCIHYPEQLYMLAIKLGKPPVKVVSWVYNSNMAKQHRDIAYFGIKPNFNLVKQPFKNQKDKRIQQLIKCGVTGARLYDWWNVNQVKNVSSQKTSHPCQMPERVMCNIIGVLPDKENIVVVDPFMGSGTTGVACQKYNVDFIGIEMDDEYFSIAYERLNSIKESKDA